MATEKNRNTKVIKASGTAKGNIALLTTAIIWGSGFIAQKIGMSYVQPLTFNGLRMLIGATVLLPVVMFYLKMSGFLSKETNTKEEINSKKTTLIKGSLLCGTLLAVACSFQQIGLTTIDAGKSAFISVLYVVLVPVVSIVFGKKIEKKVWLSVAIAIAGFALLCLRGGIGNVSLGDIITLGSALFYSFQIISVNRFVTAKNAILLSVMQLYVAGMVSTALAFIFENPEIGEIAIGIKPLLYSAFVSTAIGYTLQIVGQQYTAPTIASLLMSLESVFTVIFGAIILGESMNAMEIVGCILIFSAVIMAQIPGKIPTKEGGNVSDNR